MAFPSAALLAVTLLLSYPSPESGGFVHDFADVLPADVRARIEAEAATVERATGAELAVVTVASLEGQTVEEYAAGLFSSWGIGKRGVNNGVLLLVAPSEHRARIEVGFGLEPLMPDGWCGALLDENAIPRFRENDYAGGIEAAAHALAIQLLENPSEAKGYAGSAPAFLRGRHGITVGANLAAIFVSLLQILSGWWFRRRENYPSAAFLLGTVAVGGIGLGALVSSMASLGRSSMPLPFMLAGGAALLGTLFYNTRAFFRYGPHNCRVCGARLQLLSESDDDARLSVEQRLEEELGSVDYDVWICPSCLKDHTEPYINYLSGFSVCPKCNRRTMKETATVVSSATTLSTGQKRIDGRCAACKHATTRYVTIPRISTGSSGGGSFGSGGGGSSFGGGMSGGGGASRGW